MLSTVLPQGLCTGCSHCLELYAHGSPYSGLCSNVTSSEKPSVISLSKIASSPHCLPHSQSIYPALIIFIALNTFLKRCLYDLIPSLCCKLSGVRNFVYVVHCSMPRAWNRRLSVTYPMSGVSHFSTRSLRYKEITVFGASSKLSIISQCCFKKEEKEKKAFGHVL